MPKPGEMSHSIVESVDLFPTLAELAELPSPDYVNGVSIVPILKSVDAPGHAAYSYYSSSNLPVERPTPTAY